MLVLSTFSGIGMLDKGFEDLGFTIVSAPEKILAGDIRNFKGIAGKFDGVIGGSPCQSFSGLNRNPDNYSNEMLYEFCRVVKECNPTWFLLENVVRVPTVTIDGYFVQRFNLSPTDLGFSQSRPRTFQFGTKSGRILQLPEPIKYIGTPEPCLTASDFNKKHRRTFQEFCELQGFTTPPDLQNFTQTAKYRAIGNGVHLGVSAVIARCVLDSISSQNPLTIFNSKLCACGCGRIPTGSKKSYSDACRKRVERM